MSDTLEIVIEIVADLSGVKRERLSDSSAIYQDIGVSGDDVGDVVKALASRFGEHIWQWPWQRFAELSEPGALRFPYFIWRLLTWPVRGRLFDPSPFERLELGHIAAVIDRGEWFDPVSVIA